MKSILFFFANILIRLFYREFDFKGTVWSKKQLIQFGFRQKILGYNRHVHWPVHFTSTIKCPEKINKPKNRAPGSAAGCYIDARNGIILEENVWIGPRVSIISQNHSNLNFKEYLQDNPIIIRKNCWLAAACIILPSVELGEHTIVAAGAVVTKSFPEGNQLLAGNPAVVIKKLDSYTGS
jgi:acetyltransferase-like isoleucine patch superfamily enzyme